MRRFVRKKRRVELYLEHREASTFAGASGSSGHGMDFRPLEPTGLLQARHAACPTYAPPELVMLIGAAANFRLDLAALNKGTQDGSVHFHCALPASGGYAPNRSTNAEVIP